MWSFLQQALIMQLHSFVWQYGRCWAIARVQLLDLDIISVNYHIKQVSIRYSSAHVELSTNLMKSMSDYRSLILAQLSSFSIA